jgi:hypothetical protein
MKRVLILGIFVLAAVGQDVQHAPTGAQCRADQRLWDSQLLVPDKDWAHSANDVSARTLLLWWSEMSDCFAVDPNNLSDYSQTERHVLLVRGSRMADFIERHGLTGKFYEEDAAGKR